VTAAKAAASCRRRDLSSSTPRTLAVSTSHSTTILNSPCLPSASFRSAAVTCLDFAITYNKSRSNLANDSRRCLVISNALVRRARWAGEQCAAPAADEYKQSSGVTCRRHMSPFFRNASFCWESGLLSTRSLCRTQICHPNDISTSSAFFAQLIRVPNSQQIHRHRDYATCDIFRIRLHLGTARG